MKSDTAVHPKIASKEEWLIARKELLADEKTLTQQRDRINAKRRRLPMVRIEKDYVFEGSHGKVRLLDLFEDRRQLIIYHFMFDPAWDKGCSGCTGFVSALGDLTLLQERDTTLALISRAPFEKLDRYKAEQGWSLPWFSSWGSDFNYDFHVTLDESVTPVQYNFQNAENSAQMKGESHGLSVFFRLDRELFHTYSTYARGVESLTNSYSLLDVTPYGRQEDFEDSPPGYPQKPTYG
jgi:predicted dithiol-disulfide oxidoreductase (DUF899 family)